jgi:hypothetical protein
VPDAGHMVHQTETVAVMAAIDEVFAMFSPSSGGDVASSPMEPRRGASATEVGPRPQHAK